MRNRRLSFLDEVSSNKGAHNLKSYMSKLAKVNILKAVHLINDRALSFPSLYILQAEISGGKIYSYLSDRNKFALDFIDVIVSKDALKRANLKLDDTKIVLPALNWILETGWNMDGQINDNRINAEPVGYDNDAEPVGYDNDAEPVGYDEVLDIAAILLCKKYKDKTNLKTIVDLIFDRNTRCSFKYDIVWAFFECGDPQGLIFIINRLCSDNEKDTALAQKLLSFIPCVRDNKEKGTACQYYSALSWLEENYPFIYYTNESFHQRSTPTQFDVSLESKYLCKPLILEDKPFLRSLSQEQSTIVENLSNIDDATKRLLSNYSFLLYRQDIDFWNTWIHYPVSEQIRVANARQF